MKQLVWTMVLAAALCFCGGAAFAAPEGCIEACQEKQDQCKSDCTGEDEKCEETCTTRYVNCVQKCSR